MVKIAKFSSYIILVLTMSYLSTFGETQVRGVGTINRNRVSLHSQPNLGTVKIADTQKGQEVNVTARSDDRFYIEGKYNYWYQVELPSGGVGVGARGFSQITCLPASKAAIASGA